MKEIFAIIVTYNGMQWIKHCIESLMESTVPMQIIVIDNNSNDGTLEFIKKNYSSVITFPMNKNLGFGQANNVGIRLLLTYKSRCVSLQECHRINATGR